MYNLLKLFKKHYFFCVSVFLVSFIVRLLIFFFLMTRGTNCWFYPDSLQYHTVAQQLVLGNGFAGDNGTSQFLRLPGYPLFLALWYKVFGEHHYVALVIQIFFASLIPVFIFLLSRVLFQSHIILAYCAALISMLHTGFCIYASMVATESLSLIFLLLFYCYFFSLVQSTNNSLRDACMTGIMLGLASLIRPIGMYVLAISWLVLMISGPFIRRLQQAFVISGAWFIVVLPWLIRNFFLTGAIFFHTLPGLHFLQYSAAYVLMERDALEYDQVRPFLLNEWERHIKEQEDIEHRPLNDFEKCKVAEQLAYTYMIQYPFYTIKTSLIQILKTCCSLYTSQILLSDSGIWPGYNRATSLWQKIKRFLFPQVQTPLLSWCIYWEIITFIFMLLGLIFFLCAVCFKKIWRKTFFTALPFIMMFVVITLAYGCARLRFPIEPFFIIFSGAGWLWIIAKKTVE